MGCLPRLRHGAALIALAAWWCAAALAATPANLVTNGTFEEIADGKIAGWEAAGDGVTMALAPDAGRTGGHSARLACTGFTHGGPSSHAMLAQVGRVAVKKGERYTFSCWVREEGLRSRQVDVALKSTEDWNDCGLAAPLAVSRTWKRIELPFVATRDLAARSRLQLWYRETGTLWVDDVAIVPTPPVRAEFTDAFGPGGSRNFLANGSFEAGPAGWGSLGETVGWGNLPGLVGEVVEVPDAPNGTHALRIALGPGRTPVEWFDYFDLTRVEQASPLVANRGWAHLKHGGTYTFSAYMKSEPAGVPGRLAVRLAEPGQGAWRMDRSVTLTGGWARYSYRLTADRDWVFVAAGPDLRGAPGKAATVWVDALQLEEGGEPTAFAPREAVEVGITTDRLGNVFHPGEPVRLNIAVASESGKPARFSWDGRTTLASGKAFLLRGAPVTVPAAGRCATVFEAALPERGVFDIDVDWTAAMEDPPLVLLRGKTRLRVAVVDQYTAADSPFGINHAPVDDSLCALLRDAGVTGVRTWSLKWQAVEPSPGRFTFADSDAEFARYRALHLPILALLPPFPSSNWASSAPAGVTTNGDYPGVRRLMAYAPKDPAKLAAFIERTVAHDKDTIHAWEFLNEPLFTDYALPGKGQGLQGADYHTADYVALLKTASAAMKRADPKCTVVGGIAGWPDDQTADFIQAGGLDALDVLNLHIYPGKALPESFLDPMAKVNAEMKAAGRVLPIWITECSYYGADDRPWNPYEATSEGDWAGARLLDDEQQCAAYTVRWIAVMLASGAEKFYYHSGGNGAINEPSLECFLLGPGGIPRKAYAAQAALAKILGPHPVYAGRLKSPPGVDGLYGFVFQNGSSSVLIAWATDDAGMNWLLRLPSDVGVEDMFGNPIQSRMPLTEGPIIAISSQLLDASSDRIQFELR